MGKAAKGGEFERNTCKRLSKWWTQGESERDDIFWRSSQSGGRATQRAKFGKKTFGAYGDIAFVDPIGAPLLKMFTIELKRGSSYGYAGDLLDVDLEKSKHKWLKCLAQVKGSAKLAASKYWMLICRRDHRLPIVYVPWGAVKEFKEKCNVNLSVAPHMRFSFMAEWFIGLQLEEFLSRIGPKEIITCISK